MLRLDNGNIYYTPFGEQEVLLGKLSDGEMSEGYFTLGNVSLPVERFTELKSEWDKIYPNGKPVVVVTPIKVITEEEKYKDMVDQLMASYLASFPPIV